MVRCELICSFITDRPRIFILDEDALLKPLANYIFVIVHSRRKGFRAGIKLKMKCFNLASSGGQSSRWLMILVHCLDNSGTSSKFHIWLMPAALETQKIARPKLSNKSGVASSYRRSIRFIYPKCLRDREGANLGSLAPPFNTMTNSMFIYKSLMKNGVVAVLVKINEVGHRHSGNYS